MIGTTAKAAFLGRHRVIKRDDDVACTDSQLGEVIGLGRKTGIGTA